MSLANVVRKAPPPGGVAVQKADAAVPKLDRIGGAPLQHKGVGLVEKLVEAVQAIQGPREVPKGFFRDLLSEDTTTCMAVGGHRGMGENLWNDADDGPLNTPNLWRENTIKSFLKARQHGATFVEFDVQVTNDGVPIIWHDDLITFGSPMMPISCKIEDMSLQEFQSIGPRPTDHSGQLRELIPLQRAFRSRKTGQQIGSGSNLWQCFDDDQLPTLEDTLNLLPDDFGLNIEVKMTTPSEIPNTSPSEVDRVVNAVLKTVSDYMESKGGSREAPLLLSSFDMDVCTAMCERQQEIPVMFITTGGAEPHANPLRMSIAAAIDFACDGGMEGIVVDSSVLQREIYLVSVAKQRGLKVMTYGLGNNDIEWIKRQSDVGVHGAIVDDVAKTLPSLVAEKTKKINSQPLLDAAAIV